MADVFIFLLKKKREKRFNTNRQNTGNPEANTLLLDLQLVKCAHDLDLEFFLKMRTFYSEKKGNAPHQYVKYDISVMNGSLFS